MTPIRPTTATASLPSLRLPSPVPQRGLGLGDDIFEAPRPTALNPGPNVREHGALRTAANVVTSVLASACRRMWFWTRWVAIALVDDIKVEFERLMSLLTYRRQAREGMIEVRPNQVELEEAVDIAVRMQAQVREASKSVTLRLDEQAELNEANRLCQHHTRAAIAAARQRLEHLESRLNLAEEP